MFLPHFIDPGRSLLLQFALMAGAFVVIEFITEYILASAAHVIRPWLTRAGGASTTLAAASSC